MILRQNFESYKVFIPANQAQKKAFNPKPTIFDPQALDCPKQSVDLNNLTARQALRKALRADLQPTPKLPKPLTGQHFTLHSPSLSQRAREKRITPIGITSKANFYL